jgi:hypothetical protein
LSPGQLLGGIQRFPLVELVSLRVPLLAQFVLNTGHAARTISLRLSHNTGFGTAVTESEGTFALVPTPGAIALLHKLARLSRKRWPETADAGPRRIPVTAG